MKKLVYENYDALSKAAAEIIMNEINGSQNPVLGLPTGGTPVGMYAWLTKFYQEKKVDFANVTTFNLDEYLGLDKNHEQSYYTVMNTNLYSCLLYTSPRQARRCLPCQNLQCLKTSNFRAYPTSVTVKTRFSLSISSIIQDVYKRQPSSSTIGSKSFTSS